MREGPNITSVAAIVGDPARANILSALMSGLALTAGELAREAYVTAPTASAHLAKLRDANLVTMVMQGRHRYFRLAISDVAAALEGLMGLAVCTGNLRTRPGPHDAAMRAARVCYDHLAGTAGDLLYETLIAQGAIVPAADGLNLSRGGRARFVAEGIDLDAMSARIRCSAALVWTEANENRTLPVRLRKHCWICSSHAAGLSVKRKVGLFVSASLDTPLSRP